MGKANGKFVQLALIVPQQRRQAKGAVRQTHFLVQPGLAHRVALAASNICIVQHQLLHIGKALAVVKIQHHLVLARRHIGDHAAVEGLAHARRQLALNFRQRPLIVPHGVVRLFIEF